MNTTVLSLDQEVTLNIRTIAAVVAITATTATPVHAQQSPTPVVDSATRELAAQMRHPRVQSTHYWEKVAICESSKDGFTADWSDGGYYAGGLGIAQSTWFGYGGRQFARTPAKATKVEQMVVANRISVLGFQTVNQYRTLNDRLNGRPFFRPAVGFNGWGCIKNRKSLQPKRQNHGGKP